MGEMTRGTRRALDVLADLLDGQAHDRVSIAARADVRLAAADRIVHLISTFPGVTISKEPPRRRVLRFDASRLNSEPKLATVLAAFFAASLAPLFAGSSYEQGLRDGLKLILHRSKRAALLRDFTRKFVFLSRGGEPALADHAGDLDDLIEAVLHQKFARIKYQRFETEITDERVRPLCLAIYDHQLYVIARNDSGEDHPFRLARILEVDLESATFTYPNVGEFNPVQMFRESMGVFVDPRMEVATVRLRLAPRWSLYAKTHCWHSSQHTHAEGAHTILTLRVRQCPELRAWILGFGADAEVLEPAKLRNEIGEALAKASLIYQPNGAAPGGRESKGRKR